MLLWLVLYVIVAISFCLWDSFIGTPIGWDSSSNPLWLAAVFWPLTIPIVTIMAFSNALARVKEKRIHREKVKQKLRIALQKEEDQLVKELEQELLNERKSSHHS